MNKYKMLLLSDVRSASKDAMLLLILIGPALLIAIVRYGLVPLADWIIAASGFALTDHAGFIAVLILTLIPQMTGTAVGLLMLDERDERIIDYYTVTPLRKTGYTAYRLLLPVAISLVMLALFLPASGIGVAVSGQSFIPVLLLWVLEAPLFALFLIAAASNKVEGLALSKLVSLTLLGPICAYFLSGPWQWLAGLLPTYWPSRMFLAASSPDNTGFSSGVAFAIGLVVHFSLLYGLLRRFWNRIE